MTKRKPLLIILYCVITLGLALLSLISPDVDYSGFENRTMKYFVWPKADTLISGEWFNEFESYNLDQIVSRNTFVEVNSRLMQLMGRRTVNDIVVGKNRVLLNNSTWYETISPEYEAYEVTIDTLSKMKEACDSYGGQLYDVELYDRGLYFWDEYPYIKKTSYESWEAYFDQRDATYTAMGIHTVNTCDIMRKHRDEYLYFNTDHHYTFKGAYYTYLTLLEQINRQNPDKTPLTYPQWDSMTMVRPGKHFWGSLVSQIGDTGYEGQDYLEYCLPDDYPTEYDRFESGELSDLAIIKNDEVTEEYGWFMEGDQANTVIRTYREELPNILIIGNSFTDALEVFAIYNFNEMHSIDHRSFEGNICDYIRENKIDYVVVVGDPKYEIK